MYSDAVVVPVAAVRSAYVAAAADVVTTAAIVVAAIYAAELVAVVDAVAAAVGEVVVVVKAAVVVESYYCNLYSADSLSADCSSACPTYCVGLTSAEDFLHNCLHHDSGKANLKTDDRFVGRFVGLADSGS